MKQEHIRTFARPFRAGGSNVRGEPLGLMPYMMLNRESTMPDMPLCHVDIEFGCTDPVIWHRLFVFVPGQTNDSRPPRDFYLSNWRNY